MKKTIFYTMLLIFINFNGISIENKNSLFIVLGDGSMQCYNFLLIKDIVTEDSVCIVSDKLEINNYNFLRKIKLNDTLKLYRYPCKELKK